MKSSITILSILMMAAAGLSATYYVPTHFATIQDAISDNTVKNGDTIIVLPGTYVENIDFLGKAITVRSEQGPGATFIDGGKPAHPSLGSVARFQNMEGNGSVLTGFTLVNGSGTYDSNWGFMGGGIFCRMSSPTLSNNIVTDNSADIGGGIACDSFASPVITMNVVSGNTASWSGGIDCYLDSSPEIKNNIISENTAALSGGGVNCEDNANPVISDNSITANSANHAGGMQIVNCSPAIRNNIISNNKAVNNCGGLRCVETSLTTMVEGNTFSNNIGMYSGGIEIYDYTAVTIRNNLIMGNSGKEGGGIYCRKESHPLIKNNLILFNTAESGGGIDCFDHASPMIANNTIYGNSAMIRGGGIASRKGSYVEAENNILWKNGAKKGAEVYLGSATVPSIVFIRYSDVEGGQSFVHVEPSCIFYAGPGMIDEDPFFVAGQNGAFYLGQVAAGQPLDSPCADSGNGKASNHGMESYWTRTDEAFDTGIVDMGFHYGPFSSAWEPPLGADVQAIPEQSGGTVHFTLSAGTVHAHRSYLVLGSLTGTQPGILLPGGAAWLPLNWDLFTDLVIHLVNTPNLQDFMGILDEGGAGKAVLNLPPIPGAAGITLYFAYAVSGPWDFASNPVAIDIIP